MATNAWGGINRDRRSVDSDAQELGIDPINRDRIMGAVVAVLKKAPPIQVSDLREILLANYAEFESFLSDDKAYQGIMDYMLQKGYFIPRGFGMGILRLSQEAEQILAVAVHGRYEDRAKLHPS